MDVVDLFDGYEQKGKMDKLSVQSPYTPSPHHPLIA